ncbi:peptidoglycan amidohydrolase family protein [Enterococcus avium]|uniref:peptidoglycan amidohydrolase family protein n=1 Tax=Enterococcus avium TaxID=33945 RepID=UPI00379E9A06
MASIDALMNFMYSKQGKVSYSMAARMGPYSYDCSSAVFFALIAGGFLKQGTGIGNTESLYRLEGTLLIPISRSEVRRGDIFVAGKKGGSSGSAGHTGVFISNSEIIHCTYSKGKYNFAVTPAKGWMGDYSGLPVYYYRLKNAAVSGPTESNTQQRILAIDGSWGPATTRRLQEVLNCSIKDGIISGQIKNRANRNIPSAQFGSGGSNVVRALQKLLNTTQDGNFGPATCKMLQKRMGTLQDGEISAVSDCVKEMQRRLNESMI